MPAKKILKVNRRPELFHSDDRRVIARFFELHGDDRIRAIIHRVISLSPSEVTELLADVHRLFGQRHRNLEQIFLRHYSWVQRFVEQPGQLSDESKQLIGAYFTMEYSIESAALFNPSIVPHPEQDGVDDGDQRFLMSLRATGEGHISSIVFRTGTLTRDRGIIDLEFDQISPISTAATREADRRYDRHLFYLKLIEMGAWSDMGDKVFDHLSERFTITELENAIRQAREQSDHPFEFDDIEQAMLWLAHSNYRLKLPRESDISEIVIFPGSQTEAKGIEDVRLCRFTEDDGSVRYYGTYTAYDGSRTLPQLLESDDFHHVEVHTLNGRYVQNKGMALFPRRVGGWYTMISRLDGENMFIMHSDNIHFWNECQPLQAPRYFWEFVQIGNCGSPIETDEGWLLLTHGVGPMRRYCIGASLLDLEEPSRVIGHLREPLIEPDETERDGYVPNVVYSCGAMTYGDDLVIPYAASDQNSKFAHVKTQDVIDEMVRM